MLAYSIMQSSESSEHRLLDILIDAMTFGIAEMVCAPHVTHDKRPCRRGPA